MTANTSPISSSNRHATNKKHMQSLNKGSIGFSHSQHVSPSLSKSNKLYRSKGKDSMPTSYAFAKIGKKTYMIPTSIKKNSDKSSKHSAKGSIHKGNTAYYDALGYGKYSVPDAKSSKKDAYKLQNRLNLKMINDYEEKKAFSLVSSISNTKKDFNDPINFRGLEQAGVNKENPFVV